MSNHLDVDNFSTDQHTAVELCSDLSQRIVAVTGEAGTGKTSVLGEAVSALIAQGLRVELCAPTGRAAARIREATGHPARTVHRLLGYGHPDPNDPTDESIPERNRQSPIPADAIFVDECSMLSEDLYRNLIDSLRKGCVIRFFGDINQLPPVNAVVPPFKRILEKFPKVVLLKNFRSTDGIVQAAQSIIRGRVPKTNSRFTLLSIPNQMGLSILDKFINDDLFDPKKMQIIVPTRVGKLGAIVINSYIQGKINPGNRGLSVEFELDKGEKYLLRIKPGDKVMWTKNDYALNLFNGMIGKIVDIDEVSGDVISEFDGKDYHIPAVLEGYDDRTRKSFAYDPRKYFDLAYAITTHKSQGSEFERVVIMLYFSSVMTRQNFYTAVTRGKQHVTVLAGPGGLKSALRTDPIMLDPK